MRAVSIPRRKAKNPVEQPPVEPVDAVSIPRRKAKNPSRPRFGFDLLKFQSLVGRLKTRVAPSVTRGQYSMFRPIVYRSQREKVAVSAISTR